MNKFYQVWILTNDLELAHKKHEPILEAKMLDTQNKKLAIFVAKNYPFVYVENAMVVVEEVKQYKNGDEVCVDRLLEIPLTNN